MVSRPKIEVMYWDAFTVRVKCPYCDGTHRHSGALPGRRCSDCQFGGEYEFNYPIDEDSGLVGYEIDKKRARFVNVKYVDELEKESSKNKKYSLVEHLRVLGLEGSKDTLGWKSHESAMELYTEDEEQYGTTFTQKMMPLAMSNCLFGDIIATERYLATTKEKELFMQGRAEDDGSWDTMLIMKARDRQPDMVSLLVKHGAEVNAVNCKGRNALMEAALWGRLENVKILLCVGAEIQAKDHEGRSAFDLAQPTKANEQERYRKCHFLAADKVPEWDQRRRHISTLLNTEEPAKPKCTAPMTEQERSVYSFNKSENDLTITLRGPITKFHVQRISKTAAVLDRGSHFARTAATSGWAEDMLPRNVEDRAPWINQVLTIASMVCHQLPAHHYDRGVLGRYYASHSEKKLIAYFIEKHVFTPQDFIYDNGLQRSLDDVQDLLEEAKTASKSWGAMCAMQKERSRLEWTLLNAQDELYETDDEIEKPRRQEYVAQTRGELQQIEENICALEAKGDMVEIRGVEKTQGQLETRQRLEEKLMELGKHPPKISLRDAVIWSSNRVCEDCESFKEAINSRFGLNIQLTWI